MKVKVLENPEITETLVTIECNKVTEEVIDVANYIKSYGLNISGKKDGQKYFIPLKDIFYFEAVDNRVFAYTIDSVYEVNYKIQEIVDVFSKTSFIQISRTVILNIQKIDHVSTLINGRILAVLINKEKQIITRAYASDFKQKLRKKGE